VHGVLLRPLAYHQPDQIVTIIASTKAGKASRKSPFQIDTGSS
jgi:hypothetical protein